MLTQDNLELVIAVLVSFIASGGFWQYVLHKDKGKSATTRLMMGLAYDKIMFLGMHYIERGWISKDEFEDFQKYFFEPYKELGGNGVAEKMMTSIGNLPLKTNQELERMVDYMMQTRKELPGE